MKKAIEPVEVRLIHASSESRMQGSQICVIQITGQKGKRKITLNTLRR